MQSFGLDVNFARDPIAFILRWMSEKWNSSLISLNLFYCLYVVFINYLQTFTATFVNYAAKKRLPSDAFGYSIIFILANHFLRWICFGPTRFIHPWMTLVHATLRVSDVMDKCNILLADVTFDWCHVIVTAVERNNQTRRIITFLAAYLQHLKQNSTNNEQKRSESKV